MSLRKASLSLLTLAAILLAGLAPAAGRPAAAQQAATGSTTLISIASDGTLPTGYPRTYSSAWGSGGSRISADGTFIVFSTNLNLIPEDSNSLTDLYIYHQESQQFILASPGLDGHAAGIEGYGADVRAAISADGRYVVYDSTSSKLVPGDTNAKSDIFVFDRDDRSLSRVLTGDGKEPDDNSYWPDISGDGSRIVFTSRATNMGVGTGNSIFIAERRGSEWRTQWCLPTDDGGNPTATRPMISANGAAITYFSRTTELNKSDIFYTRLDATGTNALQSFVTTRVTMGDQDSTMPEISDDGRYVVFKSAVTNLIPGDTNSKWNIFVYDWNQDSNPSARITRVSNGYDGSQANGHSGDANSAYGGPTISGDGRYVVFPSAASNLVEGDSNGLSDIFMYDRQNQVTSLVSLSSAGAQAEGSSSGWPSMSNDHRLIVFGSSARNFSSMVVGTSRNVFLRDLTRTATPPEVLIDQISPLDITQGQDGTVSFRGTVAHTPESGAQGEASRAYAWTSSIDGLLSQEEDFSLPISRLSAGTHYISLRVIDVDGDSGQSETQALIVHPAGEMVESLILTNFTRMDGLYPNGTGTMQDDIAALAAAPSVHGVVVPVEQDAQVRTAYSRWDSDPSTARANQVAAAIKALVDRRWKSYPDLKYLVIVGDDRVIPFRRVADEVTDALESDYVGSAAAQTSVGRALADNQILTDDYYAYNTAAYAAGALSVPAYYLPDLGVGRLIETPAEISAQLQAFLKQDVIPVSRAVVSAFGTDEDGIDFLVDGGLAECQALANDGVAVDCALVGTSWRVADFRSAVLSTGSRSDLVAFSHHANHSLFGAEEGYIGAQELAAAGADLTGSLLYTLGCHAGLNVGPDYPGWQLDLAQAAVQRKANYLGNTGYGWGTSGEVGLSEDLMKRFTEQIIAGSQATPGLALADAKRDYYLGTYAHDAFDKKVSLQFTLYGLPMYRYQTPNSVAKAAAVTDGIRVSSQVTALSGSLTMNSLSYQFPPLSQVTSARGSYYTLRGQAQVANGQPIQPRYTADLSFPGTRAHGVVFRGGSYRDLRPFDPLVAAAVNEYVQPSEPSLGGAGWYPALTSRLNTLVDQDTLVAQLGQYNPASQTERIYQRLSLDVYYHADSTDWEAPTIDSVSVTRSGGTAAIQVRASDLSGVAGVVLAYTDGGGAWQSIALSDTDGRWEGSFPAGDSTRYFVQAVDGAGNVAADDNQGTYASPQSGMVYLPLVRR